MQISFRVNIFMCVQDGDLTNFVQCSSCQSLVTRSLGRNYGTTTMRLHKCPKPATESQEEKINAYFDKTALASARAMLLEGAMDFVSLKARPFSAMEDEGTRALVAAAFTAGREFFKEKFLHSSPESLKVRGSKHTNILNSI